MNRVALFFALLFSFFLLAATVGEVQSLAGYSAVSARAERDWENIFRAIPNADHQREFMRRLSARPHHVGSPYDEDNAEWLVSKIKEWGLDANLENFDVLFPTPKERLVELIEPTKFTASLQEPPVASDPTSTSNPSSSPHITPTRSTEMCPRRWFMSITVFPMTTKSSSGWAYP